MKRRGRNNAGGVDAHGLERLKEVVREDIASDRYFGGVIAIGRHGKLVFHEAFGHADSKRTRPVTPTDPGRSDSGPLPAPRSKNRLSHGVPSELATSMR